MRQRVELLVQCVSLVQFFAAGIGYGDEPIETLVSRAAKSGEMNGLVFLAVAADSGTNEDFSSRWSESVDSCSAGMALAPSDRELLKAFGSRLGTTDVQRQLELCELYRQRFSDRLTSVRSKQAEQTRAFSVGGAAAGALLFVLLI